MSTRLATLVLLAAMTSSTASAQTKPVLATELAPTPKRDDDILVYGRALAQIGTATTGSQGTIGYEDFANRPLSRVGDLVENVPGLIATQHSGTGKANQYFLRGFNLDHGTDLAGYVDGVPINMRTHGHGQGYLDFNFLIPELVERIDYAKGPHQADAGDFSATGTIRFTTIDALRAPIVEATVGGFGYARALAAGSKAVGAAPLIEDNSTRSQATTLVNRGAYYAIWRAKLGLEVLNLLNGRQNDIT